MATPFSSTVPLGKTVLLVDDDVELLEMLQELLETEGYLVQPAHHGQQALDLLVQIAFDVVVLDLMMPVKSGWEVLREMRAHTALSHIPVIVITASKEPPEGATIVLRKPFSLDDFFSAVALNSRADRRPH